MFDTKNPPIYFASGGFYPVPKSAHRLMTSNDFAILGVGFVVFHDFAVEKPVDMGVLPASLDDPAYPFS